MFPELSEAVNHYKNTERGQEEVSEVTKQWKLEGYKEGRIEGFQEGVLSLLKQRKITVEDAAKELEVDEKEIEKMLAGKTEQ